MKKQKVLLIAISFMIIAAICSATFLNGFVAEAATVDDSWYEVAYGYNGCDDMDHGYAFSYSDELMLTDYRTFSPELAKVSVGLAASAYNLSTIGECLKTMGYSFRSINYEDEREATYEDNDFVAFSIGHKTIGDFSVYIVPIRGTKVNCEWFSNFNLGEGSDHAGFYTAADEVLGELKKVLDKDEHDYDHIVVLTTGHSRGAAVANIVAGKLTEGKLVKRVLGYIFACPAVSKNANSNYSNIFNFNNPGDLIAAMPLKEWGFKRYGKDIDLDTSKEVYQNFCQRFKDVTGKDYLGAKDSYAFTNALMSFCKTQEDFNENITRFAFGIVATFLSGSDVIDTALKLAADTGVLFEFVKYVLSGFLSEISKAFLSSAGDFTEDLFNSTYNTRYIIQTKMMEDLQTALNETEDLDDEELQIWFDDNEAFLRDVQDLTGVYPTNREDLNSAMIIVYGYVNQTSDFRTRLYSVLALFCSGKGKDTIFHAHTGETYILWINSMYYGFEGWVENGSVKSVDLNEYYIPETITKYDSIKEVGYACFSMCSSLENVVFTNDMKYIADYSFYDCEKINKILIPNGVFYIGDYSLVGCPLEEITIPVDHEYYKVLDSHEINRMHLTPGKTGVMDDSISTEYKDGVDFGITFELRTTLKKVIMDEGIISIPNKAFYECACLESVSLPSTLKTIGRNAFLGCEKLDGVDLSSNVESIGEGAFQGCSSLTRIDIPKKITRIEESAFDGCSLLEVYFENQEHIDQYIVIPENINYIGDHAFYGCEKAKGLFIPNEIEYIGDYSFAGCPLEEITIPVDHEYYKVLDSHEINRMHLTPGKTGVMDDSISAGYKDEGGFGITFVLKTTLKTVVMDEGIINIPDKAFYDCAYLESVSLPSTLKTIGMGAFYDTGLKHVYYNDTKEQWSKIDIDRTNHLNDCLSRAVIHCTDGVNSGWYSDGVDKYYYDENGTMITGLKAIDGNMYYFDDDGKMQKGWIDIIDKTYFFAENGKMVTGVCKIGDDTYYFEKTGVLKTGVLKTSKGVFYLDPEKGGAMHTGWLDYGKNRFYFADNGKMVKGVLRLPDNVYYFNSKGILQTGVLQTSKGVFYLDPEKGGAMHTGWLDYGKNRYYFASNGKMVNGVKKITAIPTTSRRVRCRPDL